MFVKENIVTDQEIKEKVKTVLKMMEQQFHKVEPSLMNAISRQEYFEKHPELTQEQKLNLPFSLSAQDIIDKNIPWLVSGCTGCSRLFSKYAREIGLNDFKVVLTVNTDQIGKKEKGQLHGHQVIAVNMSDGLHMIDVQHGLGKSFEEIEVKSKCRVDEKVNFQRHNGYTIAAILTPQEYDTVDSYEKIKKIYLGCNTAKKILLNNATNTVNNKKQVVSPDNQISM